MNDIKNNKEYELNIDSEFDSEVITSKKSEIEDILFRLPVVKNPLVGSPREIQPILDDMAQKLKNIDDNSKLYPSLKNKKQSSKKTKTTKKELKLKIEGDEIFNKIHLYMHSYLISIVLRQFPYIKGLETVDIYQETLIALRFKAIPNFKTGKGMSFLNFAKMCIRRHLITLLNTSKNRQKDQSINQAISLDLFLDKEDGCSFSNLVSDGSNPINESVAEEEAYLITKNGLKDLLSNFENLVIEKYLDGYSYFEIAQLIFKNKFPSKNQIKSIDNALLRIRSKASSLINNGISEKTPLFF